MHDLIYCFRMLRKRPSFTLVAVLTLALAIGASTALFSIVNVVVLNPFPYKDPSRLFFVRQSLPKIGVQDQFRASGPEFVEFAKSGVFERVTAFESVSRNLTGSDEPERVAAGKVSTEFFNLLGVEPLLGRTIAPSEQGPNGQRVLVTEDWPLTIESVANAGAQTQSIDTRTVSSDYFTTLQIPLLGGQTFGVEDGPQAQPVVIVNETMANRYWPNQDSLGKRIKIGNLDSKSPWFSVKGVVKDSAQASLDREIRPEVYFALGQMAGRYRRMNLEVRTSVDPKSTVAAIQAAIREVDKDQPVYQIQTIDELIRDSIGTRRFALAILIMFAVLALVLAVSGIYGVISYSVTQRTQEIGIRMALGARAADVLRLVLGQFMRLTLVGVGLGLIAAYALTRLMASLLFGVTPTDVTTFILVSIGLSLVALVACLIPARRATRVDPLVALRYE